MFPRRFHADQRRPGKLPIETLGLSRTMHQLLLLRFPSHRVHPTNLLPTRMKITSNNQHRRLLSFPNSWSSNQRIQGPRTELSFLSNQFLRSPQKWGLFPSAGSTHKPVLVDAGKRISFVHYG